MFRFLWIILLAGISLQLDAQSNCIAIGRNIVLPAIDSIQFEYKDSLPEGPLDQYACILVFSSAHSNLDTNGVRRLQEYMQQGGGLYIGADNWPFVAESNQLTFAILGRHCWGNREEKTAVTNLKNDPHPIFGKLQTIPAGITTVVFPLDYRLKVEAWAGDEPLILSGRFNSGRLILDGGYSRFNMIAGPAAAAQAVFRDILYFLIRR